MRVNKPLMEKIESGRLLGRNRVNARVTVEPDWQLGVTTPTYASTLRGPYRYYADNADNRLEVEVPQVKSIQIDRSLAQDIATCKITLYNQYHNGNSIVPELGSQLGKPGYFWPKRGEQAESNLLWGQTTATGATLKNGTWDANFEWTNVLLPNALLRTRAGYGGLDLSIEDAESQGYIMLTGVWLIDRISGGADGTLMIECRDVGRLLLEQIVFPPLIPTSLYPLEYYPPGKSAFDSSFGAKPVTGVGLVSTAEVRLLYHNSSFGDGAIAGHYASEAADMNTTNWSWSPSVATSDSAGPYHWWGFTTVGGPQVIEAVDIRAWGGGYMAYVSVWDGTSWLGSETVPQIGGGNVPYLKKMQLPYHIPDGNEPERSIQFDAPVTAIQVRVTLGPSFYYSSVSDGGGTFYRTGLRTCIAERTGAPVEDYYAPFDQVLWTYAMAPHPVRGYWVADDDGYVYGFGDAADYDSSTYGSVSIGYYAGINGQNNIHLVALAAHPSGKGYWALDNTGKVSAFGASIHYGETVVGAHPYMDGHNAMDITSTHTGNGYWVCYSNGVVIGFGDATPNYVNIPVTPAYNYMVNYGPKYIYLFPDANPFGFIVREVGPDAYSFHRACTTIVSHPTKMGFWAADGCGQVFAYGACEFHGELTNRWYNQGAANSFQLNPSEWPTKIETTRTGNGYWLLFPSGHIASFGDAINQGTSYIYKWNSQIGEISTPSVNQDWSFFRGLAWSIGCDPDGSGFWVLLADGSVLGYDADWWGHPGWKNRGGYRWHDGNTKDLVDIIKDLLAWAGFTYYDSAIPNGTPTGTDRPPILGNIESMGIPTISALDGSKWDKRTVIDCINELKQVTGYSAFVDEEGAFRFESPNFWRAGNQTNAGIRLYAKYENDGTWNLVDESDPDAEPFIPVIHEAIDMMQYQASLDGDMLRSEIIIGSDFPDANDPSKTKFVRFVPPSATEEVRPGVPALRGITRPAAWVNSHFEEVTENLLMAELISLRIWFAQRTGSVRVTGNPCLSLNDQVKLIERNTSETFIHIINSISSNIDLDQGTWTMDLQTNWLGDADDWVITSSNTYNPITHVGVSERVDRWQLALEKGLQFHGEGTSTASINGGFG